MKKRNRLHNAEPPVEIPEAPRVIPDVEVPRLAPDLSGSEGGGGAYPGGPTGLPKNPDDDEQD
jgi:hypothetical protein